MLDGIYRRKHESHHEGEKIDPAQRPSIHGGAGSSLSVCGRLATRSLMDEIPDPQGTFLAGGGAASVF